MNKDVKKAKGIEEVDLIAEYEMEYGDPGNWSDKIHKEFDEKWNELQKKYEIILPVTEIHAKLFKRLNKIAPDRLEDIVQRLEQIKML